jgi:hypothetical protein
MKLVNFGIDLEQISSKNTKRFRDILEECTSYPPDALKRYFGYKLQSDVELKQLIFDAAKDYHERPKIK